MASLRDRREAVVREHRRCPRRARRCDALFRGDPHGLPPTGRAFTCRVLAIFEFESESDGIVCERVYFDTATIQRQLGIAHDPLTLKGRLATVLNHPVTIAGAFLRRARSS